MSDPLSVAAGVVGIISLGIQVGEALYKYYDDYRDRDDTIKRVSDRLGALVNVLRLLQETIQRRKFRQDEVSVVVTVNSSVSRAEQNILVLAKKCDKIQQSSSHDLKGTIVLAGRQITYPFRKGTLEKLDETIRAIQENLNLAVNVLQLRDGQQLQNDAEDIKRLTETIRAAQVSENIRGWLKAPDATINHNSNCAKRHPGSGLWFIQSPEFSNWLHQANSFLWLAGFAGSGKSVLCSTAIQYAFRQRNVSSRVAVACFYFTFTDLSKQDTSAMLRALLLQLGGQAPNGGQDLSTLHSRYRLSTPDDIALLEYLWQIVQKLDHVYILIDALDEVPRGRQRNAVLDVLKHMNAWSCTGLHLLVTSREELDIRAKLPIARQTVMLKEGSGVDQDIKSFVESQLKTDQELLRWKKHHEKIERVLTEKAHGVFRWVECQLESIKQCPRSVGQLNACLESLPEDLDETYERILSTMRGQSARDARRILMALAFAIRPLTVPEVIEIVAVDLEEPPHLDRDLRYEDADDLHAVCPGLIQVYNPRSSLDSLPLVRIAHFSVQEYLESPRIQQQKARDFALDKLDGHKELLNICVAYLLDEELAQPDMSEHDLEALPLVDYAAEYWSGHYLRTALAEVEVRKTVLKLLTTSRISFQNCMRLYSSDDTMKRRDLNLRVERIASPLYYISMLGLIHIAEDLIHAGADVNAREGDLGSALIAACYRGRAFVVETLLDHGADIDAEGPLGPALFVAIYLGRKQVARTLIDRGADVNLPLRTFGTALMVASRHGDDEMVQLLLDNGADANIVGGLYGTALRTAAGGGRESTVRKLLAAHADVNIQAGVLGTALEAALENKEESIAQLLIEHGAVNNQGE